MLIARPNFKSISEIRPTISFTLSQLEGKVIEETSLKVKNLRCFEIQYRATGHIALQLLASGKEMCKKLEALDMHASYKRGVITFQILTSLDEEKVEEYVQQKGRHYFIYYNIVRKSKNIARWMINRKQINEEYDGSIKTRKFVLNLSQINGICSKS